MGQRLLTAASLHDVASTWEGAGGALSKGRLLDYMLLVLWYVVAVVVIVVMVKEQLRPLRMQVFELSLVLMVIARFARGAVAWAARIVV